MFPWQEILELVARRTVEVYFEPVFWIILALVGFQYWQMKRSQQRMFGVNIYSLRHQILLAAFYGSIGGLLGSLLLTVFGITLNKLGFNYIWPLAILLMAISTRFLCFAYAGGLVAIANVIFGWPEVNVPQVLALVAILHITESLLIAVSGRYSASPLIVKRPNGQLVGAFNLQNFWPLPLVLLVAGVVPESQMPSEVINIGDWWPVLPAGMELPPGHSWLHSLVPVVAALGYTDMAVASHPVKRRLESALHLALYSIVLLTLAILSAKYHMLQIIAAIVSPLGHELLIQLDNRRETEGKPLFVPPERGVMVLDTVIDTPARKLGLKPGDIITSLAGSTVNNGWQLAAAIDGVPEKFEIVWERNGREMRRRIKFFKGERRLGIILVPEGHEESYVELVEEKFALSEWWKRRKGN